MAKKQVGESSKNNQSCDKNNDTKQLDEKDLNPKTSASKVVPRTSALANDAKPPRNPPAMFKGREPYRRSTATSHHGSCLVAAKATSHSSDAASDRSSSNSSNTSSSPSSPGRGHGDKKIPRTSSGSPKAPARTIVGVHRITPLRRHSDSLEARASVAHHHGIAEWTAKRSLLGQEPLMVRTAAAAHSPPRGGTHTTATTKSSLTEEEENKDVDASDLEETNDFLPETQDNGNVPTKSNLRGAPKISTEVDYLNILRSPGAVAIGHHAIFNDEESPNLLDHTESTTDTDAEEFADELVPIVSTLVKPEAPQA